MTPTVDWSPKQDNNQLSGFTHLNEKMLTNKLQQQMNEIIHQSKVRQKRIDCLEENGSERKNKQTTSWPLDEIKVWWLLEDERRRSLVKKNSRELNKIQAISDSHHHNHHHQHQHHGLEKKRKLIVISSNNHQLIMNHHHRQQHLSSAHLFHLALILVLSLITSCFIPTAFGASLKQTTTLTPSSASVTSSQQQHQQWPSKQTPKISSPSSVAPAVVQALAAAASSSLSSKQQQQEDAATKLQMQSIRLMPLLMLVKQRPESNLFGLIDLSSDVVSKLDNKQQSRRRTVVTSVGREGEVKEEENKHRIDAGGGGGMSSDAGGGSHPSDDGEEQERQDILLALEEQSSKDIKPVSLRRLIKRSGISDQRLAEIQMIRALKKQLERAAKLAESNKSQQGVEQQQPESS